MEKRKPIILDRSRLEQFSTCPRQAYLSMLFDAAKAKAEGFKIFDWESEKVKNADPVLMEKLSSVALQSTTGTFAECGIEIHSLIEKAFNECKNDLLLVPEYFVDNLPKIKPNVTPMAIRHARHVADMIADYHVDVIGLELQVSLVIIPETETTPAVVATTRIDLLGSGKGNLHIADFKTGFKRRSNTEAKDSFQASFIALLLFNQPEYKDINTIHFWYYETMFGTKAYAKFERNEEHPRMLGLTTEVALKGRVVSAVKLFMDDCRDAWPLPNNCAWCDMIRFCPQASIDAKEIADDPTAFVDNLVTLVELVKRRKAALTAYIKGNGPVEGTKVVFTKTVPQDRFAGCFQDKAKPKSGPTGDTELDSHFS